MDFSKFTIEDLQDMLSKHKKKLAHMMEIADIHSQAQTIKAIESEIQEREDGKTKQ